MLNPYASHLGDLDPVEVIATTPAKLRALLDTIGGERAEQPRAPGKWSAREIVCHLADCEVAFAFRLRRNLALVRSFSTADLARPVNHPERGDMTLQTIVETMAGHDRNHLKQVEEIAG